MSRLGTLAVRLCPRFLRRFLAKERGGNNAMKKVCVEGPVDLVGGKLTLRIPLEEGGRELAPLVQQIGEVKDGCLSVVIPLPLAEKLRIGAGSLVVIDNHEGRFRVTRSAANDEGYAQGPVETIGGELILRIPLSAGGSQLAESAGDMGRVEGEYLIVRVPPQLAESLGIGAGDTVVVSDQNRKLVIARASGPDSTNS
jgi:antitoxin component of MazEF toxin-antitoxin module